MMYFQGIFSFFLFDLGVVSYIHAFAANLDRGGTNKKKVEHS